MDSLHIIHVTGYINYAEKIVQRGSHQTALFPEPVYIGMLTMRNPA